METTIMGLGFRVYIGQLTSSKPTTSVEQSAPHFKRRTCPKPGKSLRFHSGRPYPSRITSQPGEMNIGSAWQ